MYFFLAFFLIVPVLQKTALENRIDTEWEYRDVQNQEKLYLSFNFEQGTRLSLSDGSAYEVAPEDRIYSAYWITPFPVEIGRSESKEYPLKLTNLQSGTSVKVKAISYKEILEEKKAPPPCPPNSSTTKEKQNPLPPSQQEGNNL